MPDDLKRVGIKLTADGAKDYRSALKECTAATKENWSELKLAQSQYDKNTSSMKKLEDRQKYLAGQTDVYKDKVKILNSQLKEMESAENRDEVAIAKKRAELNEAQSKLNGYEKSLADVNKQLSNHTAQLKEWGGKIKDVGGKTKAVGDGMTKYVTAPIAGMAGAAFVAFNEVDSGMDTMIAKTGATGSAADDLRTRMQNIATTIPTDFDTAANAVGEVNTRFHLTGTELEDLSTKFIQFASLNNTDVSSSVDGVQKVMEQFNLSTADAGPLLDAMNYTGQQTGISMDALQASLLNNGTALQSMGLSVTDSISFLGQLETSGINADTAMAGMRRALANAAKEGKPLDQALQELQGSLQGAGSDAEATQMGIDMFGRTAGPAIAQAVRDGKLSFEEFGTSMDGYLGSVENTYNATLDPADKLKTSMNDMKILGADLVETSAPLITDVMRTLRDVVKELSDKWNGLSEDQQQMIVKAALIVAALGPVISILGSIVIGIGAVVASGATLGIIAAIIVTVIVTINNFRLAIKVLGAAWEWLKKTGQSVWEGLKSTISSVLTTISNTITNIWNTARNTTINVWNSIKSAISGAINGAKTTVTNVITGIQNTISGAWERIRSITTGKFEAIKDAITRPIESAKDVIENLIDKIKDLFSFDWNMPELKLPHINVGRYIEVPVLGTIPDPTTLSVDWYKKGYQKAAYYASPTVRPDGRGFGDGTGGEFAVGERHLRNVIRQETGNSAPGNFIVNMTINGASGQDVRELADLVSSRLQAAYEREKAAWA